MKKTFYFIVLLLVIGLAVTACTSPKKQDPAQLTQQGAEGLPKNQENSDQENKQPLKEQTFYFGKVKNIIGNELTLDLAENPVEELNDNIGGQVGEEAAPQGGSSVAMTLAVPAQSSLDVPVEEKMELNYLGEEKAFTVPPGASIFDLSHGQQVQLANLKKGAVLLIKTQGDTSVVAEIEIWE